jgi:hypothetical protein
VTVHSRTLSIPQGETPQVRTVHIDTSRPLLERAIASLKALANTPPKGSGKALADYHAWVKAFAEKAVGELSSPE